MPIPILSYEELGNLASLARPHVVFHGTTSICEQQIESHGWLVDWKPYEISDLGLVQSLSEAMGNFEKPLSIGFRLNHRKATSQNPYGAWFTTSLKSAATYSQMVGGETLINLRYRIRELSVAAAEHPSRLSAENSESLASLVERYRVKEELSAKGVIYAVEMDPEDIEGDFREWLSRLRAHTNCSDEYHACVRSYGQMLTIRNIPPTRILAKTCSL